MTQQGWSEQLTARIAAEIKRLRGERSAQWLSDRTAEFGHRVSRSTISDMEVGRRTRLELSEMIVMARALNVPPALLLYPQQPSGMVEVVPGVRVPSRQALTWFSGDEPFRYENDAGEVISEDDEYGDGARLLILIKEHGQLIDTLRVLSSTRERHLATMEPGDLNVTVMNGSIRQHVRRLAEVRKQIADIGTEPFSLPYDIERIVASALDGGEGHGQA